MAPINNTVVEVAGNTSSIEYYAQYDRVNPYKDWNGYGDSDDYLASLSKRISGGGSVKGTTSWAYRL